MDQKDATLGDQVGVFGLFFLLPTLVGFLRYPVFLTHTHFESKLCSLNQATHYLLCFQDVERKFCGLR